MNRTEVLEQIEPILDLQVRQIEHQPRTRVMVMPDMVTLRPGGGARILEVAAPEGMKSLVKYTGLPENLTGSLSLDTLGRVMTELLFKKQRYNVMLKGGRIVGVTKPGHYQNLNPERVLRTVENTIRGVDFHRVLTLPEYSVQLETIGHEERAVTRGDLVRAGALMMFSPIGTIQPSVQSYVLRLECTNGATSTDVLRQFEFTGGEGDDVWRWFRQSIQDAYRSVGQVVNHWQQMRNERLTPEDRPMVLEAMIREARISVEVAEAIRARAIESPPQTTYDVMNLITWASSHVIERPVEVRRAQQAAAEFASEVGHRRICPVCHHER